MLRTALDIGKVAISNDLEKAVIKATNADELLPKEKHVECERFISILPAKVFMLHATRKIFSIGSKILGL
jgi:hypothetical protein